jgi:ribulose-phosphate 3-epimerase
MGSDGVTPDFVAKLGTRANVVLPSLLLCDFGHLADEILRLEASGIQGFHLDVMDGHFVPNLTYGMTIVEAVRKTTDLPLDVHLMIDNPGEYLEQFRAAGSDQITIHVEAVADPRPSLEEIRALGAAAGLALNPPTPLSAIEAAVPYCDTILVMSVMPGFGGQKFDRVALQKLNALRRIHDWNGLLEVDGGVNHETISACAAAGADLFVVGSAIFDADDYPTRVRELTDLAARNVEVRFD